MIYWDSLIAEWPGSPAGFGLGHESPKLRLQKSIPHSSWCFWRAKGDKISKLGRLIGRTARRGELVCPPPTLIRLF